MDFLLIYGLYYFRVGVSNYYHHAKIILSDVYSHMTYPRCSIRYVLDCAKLAMLCSCFIYNALYILLTLVTSKILTFLSI